jgi:uncharacterized membrane protein (DUF373 family)
VAGRAEPDRSSSLDRFADQAMLAGERVVYLVVGALLLVTAAAALVAIGYDLVEGLDGGTLDAVSTTLDGLLLVFILVELLGAVRATVTERKLVAEPFLVVGIIASIKEIIVAALALADADGREFEEGTWKIGVLGVVVLLLAVSGFLVRRKEREPSEQ